MQEERSQDNGGVGGELGTAGIPRVPAFGNPLCVDTGPVDAGIGSGEVQRRHLRWAEEHGVFCSEEERRRFAAMDIGALASLLYPRAPGDTEDVRLVADWCAWLLLRDDRWDSTSGPAEWERLAELDRAYLRLMRGRPLEADWYEREGLYGALADLLERLRERGRQEGLECLENSVDRRLVAVMKEFFFSSVEEVSYQRRGRYPTLSEYVKLRSVTGGLDILTYVISALEGVRIPERLLQRPALERLTEASHNICCWHNDLVSLGKELANAEVHNLVVVLYRDPQTACSSLSGAVDTAVRMIQEEIETFRRLEAEIYAAYEADLRWDRAAAWYGRVLHNRVGGVIVWHEACAARYREAAMRGA